MRTNALALVFAVSSSVLISGALLGRQPLTFEERVKALEAIERVYYAKRIWPKENPGPKPPFEQMMPRSQIEAKVTDYLKKNAALDQFWQRPITGDQLQAEMDRMVKGTKDPATLKELFAALNDDPHLIAECLARPFLADRLIRNWYAYDSRFHGELKREADDLRRRLTPANFPYLDAGRYHAVKIELKDPSSKVDHQSNDLGALSLEEEDFTKAVAEYPPEGTISPVEETAGAFFIRWTERRTERSLEGGIIVIEKEGLEDWFYRQALHLDAPIPGLSGLYTLNAITPAGPRADPTSPDSWKALWYVPRARYLHTAVWTGTEMIVWGGYSSDYLNTGGRYSPATDTWTATSTAAPCPAARDGHTAVWTGTVMIVWGGDDGFSPFNTGGRYSPATDTWTATSTGANCPAGHRFHTAVWTGTEMIVWGGAYPTTNTGGRYSPASNTWTATSTAAPCPSARSSHTAVWTGTEMVIWGGLPSTYTGGRYSPASNSWTATSTAAPCPATRSGHTAVWTGTEMIVWGGWSGGAPLNSGGRYSPVSDTWTATSTSANCPTGRDRHTAVWTGTEMIVWGGTYGINLNTGGRYSPISDTWMATSTGSNCPTVRLYHTAVWTGTEMIVWGGSPATNTGGRYTPSSDTWTTTSTSPCPDARYLHTAVWTGMEMVVWGGSLAMNTGGRYAPSSDTWTATSTAAPCPDARQYHMVVWTGTEMIVWGGYSTDYLDTGGRYSPATDTWTATSTGANCPSARYLHTAVWTGTEMIILGGYGGVHLNTGGRYAPSSNTWTATSTGANCPAARSYHQAVWTGTEMIVWGGSDGGVGLNTGGRYAPSSDSWTATSTAAPCPASRNRHTAVWTGTEMIVWGGYGSTFLNTGGRYAPSSDTWTATSTGANCPAPRYSHTAVWTGTEMIVWGGYGDSSLNTGGRYSPASNAWTATSTGANCPAARSYHTAVWTGEAMIIWDGNPSTLSGGLFFPNTAPLSLPALSTSIGGDATFVLGTGETLALNGTVSTDGSNPFTTTPYHDKFDSIALYEWDLDGDANYGTQCSSSASGVDRTGAAPATLTESDLASLGITAPGFYTLWLRVTDEVGIRSCSAVTLTVYALFSPPGEASRTTSMQAEKTGGQVHATYAAACNATGHAVYWGDLSQVSTYGWSGLQCVSGAPAIDFTPPAGSLFFVVVGNNGAEEGSYGTRTGGTQRPEATGLGACDLPQQLTGTCDP